MIRIAACALLATALAAAPAFAGKPDHAGGKPDHAGKGKGNGGKSSGKGGSDYDSDDDRDGGVSIVFSSGQRSHYHEWYAQEYGRGHCPPGLAKKNNGCMPPGLAKKRYAIGQPLPSGIVIGVIPPSLAVILGPPPSGYRYGIVDGDVVKLAVGTLLVVDALQGLMN